jgi:hypothetical protein
MKRDSVVEAVLRESLVTNRCKLKRYIHLRQFACQEILHSFRAGEVLAIDDVEDSNFLIRGAIFRRHFWSRWVSDVWVRCRELPGEMGPGNVPG